MKITDQQSDISRKYLFKEAGRLADSDFAGKVKRLSLQPTDNTKIASDRFAWPEMRLFPVDSMADTVMSKVYFDSQRDGLPSKTADEISSRLDTYLNLHDIPEDGFARIVEKTAASEFSPRYLIPSIKMCKVADVTSLEAAGSLFDRDYDHLKIDQRVEFAHNFVKAAKELDHIKYPKSVAKYACELDTDLANTQHMLRLRAAAAKRIGNDGSQYLKMAEAIGSVNESPEPKDLKKLAECIDTIDVRCGLGSAKNRRKIPCAYSIVFNKEAVDEGDKSKNGLDPETMTKGDIVARFGEEAMSTLEDEEGKLDRKKLKIFLEMQAGK